MIALGTVQAIVDAAVNRETGWVTASVYVGTLHPPASLVVLESGAVRREVILLHADLYTSTPGDSFEAMLEAARQIPDIDGPQSLSKP